MRELFPARSSGSNTTNRTTAISAVMASRRFAVTAAAVVFPNMSRGSMDRLRLRLSRNQTKYASVQMFAMTVASADPAAPQPNPWMNRS